MFRANLKQVETLPISNLALPSNGSANQRQESLRKSSIRNMIQSQILQNTGMSCVT
jgi:hypothetical protein